jgi:hypothetical protein
MQNWGKFSLFAIRVSLSIFYTAAIACAGTLRWYAVRGSTHAGLFLELVVVLYIVNFGRVRTIFERYILQKLHVYSTSWKSPHDRWIMPLVNSCRVLNGSLAVGSGLGREELGAHGVRCWRWRLAGGNGITSEVKCNPTRTCVTQCQDTS